MDVNKVSPKGSTRTLFIISVGVGDEAAVWGDGGEHPAEGVALVAGREGLGAQQGRGRGEHSWNCSVRKQGDPVWLGGGVGDDLALFLDCLPPKSEGEGGGYAGAVVDPTAPGLGGNYPDRGGACSAKLAGGLVSPCLSMV